MNRLDFHFLYIAKERLKKPAYRTSSEEIVKSIKLKA